MGLQLTLFPIRPRRDPNPRNDCEHFDARGYDGRGDCYSDGHYECERCSRLSPRAPRFTETDTGRGARLRLFWSRQKEACS